MALPPWPKVGQNKQWGSSWCRNLKCKQQFSYGALLCEASREISKLIQVGISGPLKLHNTMLQLRDQSGFCQTNQLAGFEYH